MILRVKTTFDRFLSALDSEGVGIFQAIVYIHLALGGLYVVVVARSEIQAVEEAMGPVINDIWLWLCIGVTICLFGKILSGKPKQRPYWVHTTGLHLQLAGDVFAWGAFAGYVLATMQTTAWGKAVLAVWVFAGLADCAALLIMRDIRRIAQSERTIRRRR